MMNSFVIFRLSYLLRPLPKQTSPVATILELTATSLSRAICTPIRYSCEPWRLFGSEPSGCRGTKAFNSDQHWTLAAWISITCRVDMGALVAVPTRLGRGGARSFCPLHGGTRRVCITPVSYSATLIVQIKPLR